MGLDLLYRNIESMNILHKSRNMRKDLQHLSPTLDNSDNIYKSPTITADESDSDYTLTPNLQYLEISNSRKSKTILPKRSLIMSNSETLRNDCGVKYCNEPYYSGNTFLWNTMMNNLNYEKTGWSDSNWTCNDWNGVGSDLTTNSGTVNSLNEEKNSDIFQNTNNNNYNDNSTNSYDSSNSNLNGTTENKNTSFSTSKSLSSEGTKNDSTPETTPDTMVRNSYNRVSLNGLNRYQFPSLLKSFKDVNSFLNNHPPLSNYNMLNDNNNNNKENNNNNNDKSDSINKDNNKKEENKDNRQGKNKKDIKDGKDINLDKDYDLNSIIQSNGPPVTVKVYTSWNGDGENTTSVKKSEKVQLVARSGNWIYVRVVSNPNRYGWIPEFTLVESEMLSRKMLSN